VAHPCTQFWNDLKPLLQTWINDGKQILIGLDVNKQVNHPEVTNYFNSVGMTEAILHWHGQDVPPTHQCGLKAINGIFVMNGLLGYPSRYLSGLAGVSGNHHCLWMDLPEQWLFGGSIPVIVWPGAHWLKLDDPCTQQQYLKNLESFFAEHFLLQKVQQIESNLLTQTLQLHHEHEAELERLDDLQIQGMLQAKCQCWNLHTQPYGWTLELTKLMAEIRY